MCHLFTIGISCRPKIEDFLSVLKEHGIQCVVDVRANVPPGGVYGRDNMLTILRVGGLFYLPFETEFGRWSGQIRGITTQRLYEKVCRDECFQKGISRLQAGLSKGLQIVLMGWEAEPEDGMRYWLLGRKLSELGCQVLHILRDNRVESQEMLQLHARNKEAFYKQKNAERAAVGRLGEDIAAAYLVKQGFGILDRNWNLYHGCELDIVAHRNGMLHFVEVKTRSTNMYGGPEQAVDEKKMRHLYKAIREYMKKNNLWNFEFQIDTVAIVLRTADDYDLSFFGNVQYFERRHY